jgi:hypothetical protein
LAVRLAALPSNSFAHRPRTLSAIRAVARGRYSLRLSSSLGPRAVLLDETAGRALRFAAARGGPPGEDGEARLDGPNPRAMRNAHARVTSPTIAKFPGFKANENNFVLQTFIPRSGVPPGACWVFGTSLMGGKLPVRFRRRRGGTRRSNLENRAKRDCGFE